MNVIPWGGVNDFRQQMQAVAEMLFPATLVIDGVAYQASIVSRSGAKMTEAGGFVQQREAVFWVSKNEMQDAIVCDVTQPERPLKRILITHQETGIKYRLTMEWNDVNHPNRKLTCEQAEG